MPSNINLSQQPEEVQLAAHAIGLDNNRPYQRHGKLFYNPYRNFFATHDQSIDYPVWVALEERGYAMRIPARSFGNFHDYTFELTRSGLDWLEGCLGIIIDYDEEC